MLYLGSLFICSLIVAAVDIGSLITIASYVVTAASSALLALHWLEGLLVIFMPRDPLQPSRFWRFYDKLLKGVEYVSMSRQALGGAAARAATPEQMLTIAEMAAERGVDVRQIALSFYQKDLNALTQREASEIIVTHLKAIAKSAGA